MAGKTVVVGIKNLEECINKFKSVGDIDLTPVISKATRIVQRDAKILAPVDTGNLMNHIFAKTLKKETVSGATSYDYELTNVVPVPTGVVMFSIGGALIGAGEWLRRRRRVVVA